MLKFPLPESSVTMPKQSEAKAGDWRELPLVEVPATGKFGYDAEAKRGP